ncbi:MAG: SLC13 family permease [Rhizobiales bacterium TMED168]|nr:MAG: SLC13 family permease [Rhizobiales bacterium TMED168]
MFSIDLYMWFVFGLIFVGVILFSLDKIPIEITSLAIISILIIIFQNSPFLGAVSGLPVSLEVILRGFANPSLIALMCLLVIGHGLLVTGALEDIAVWMSGDKSQNTQLKFFSIMFLVFVLSALLNNTPIIVMFIPIILSLCKQLDQPSRYILIPLSYVCILGGMTTLIGSSTNLLVSGSVFSTIGKEIGFFDFTKQGMILAIVGFLYAVFLLPVIIKLFSKKNKDSEDDLQNEGQQYIVEIIIENGNPLIGKKFISGLLPELENCSVRLITRKNEKLLPPYDEVEIELEDKITLSITKGNLTSALKRNDQVFSTIGKQSDSTKPEVIIEAAITPGSFLIGRSISQTNFENEVSCRVIGIQKGINTEVDRLNSLKLNAGNIILLKGSEKSIRSLRGIKDIFPIEWSTIYLPSKLFALRARLIFIFTIFLASSGIFNITAAAVMGAALMLIFRVLNVKDAVMSLDPRIYLLVASTIMLSIALQETGGAKFIADSMYYITAELSLTAVLSILFIFVAIITNFISNNATAVLFTPIAISLASDLNMQPEPFIYCIIFAANCSFATPMGYQTNLMVMGPGNYRFKDFLISGIPLVIILWITYTLMITYIGY